MNPRKGLIGIKVKIAKRQLRRIIKEEMTDHWDDRDKIAMSGMREPEERLEIQDEYES